MRNLMMNSWKDKFLSIVIFFFFIIIDKKIRGKREDLARLSSFDDRTNKRILKVGGGLTSRF